MSDEYAEPWTVFDGGERGIVVIQDRDSFEVARLESHFPRRLETALAMAATRDLLAALEALADEAFINMRGGKGHLIDDARAAIAKAKGGAT